MKATLVLMLVAVTIGCSYCLPMDDQEPVQDGNLMYCYYFLYIVILKFAGIDCYTTSSSCSGTPIPTHSSGHCCEELGGLSYKVEYQCHQCEKVSGPQNYDNIAVK